MWWLPDSPYAPCSSYTERQSWPRLGCHSSRFAPSSSVSNLEPSLHPPRKRSHEGPPRTNRLTPTHLSWVSLHDVHWTLKVYQKGFSSESSGRRLVTLSRCQPAQRCSRETMLDTYPPSSAVILRANIAKGELENTERVRPWIRLAMRQLWRLAVVSSWRHLQALAGGVPIWGCSNQGVCINPAQGSRHVNEIMILGKPCSRRQSSRRTTTTRPRCDSLSSRCACLRCL